MKKMAAGYESIPRVDIFDLGSSPCSLCESAIFAQVFSFESLFATFMIRRSVIL